MHYLIWMNQKLVLTLVMALSIRYVGVFKTFSAAFGYWEGVGGT